MISVYITVKSKKLSEDFCSSINKSEVAAVTDTFFTLKDCREKLAIQTPDILLIGLQLSDGSGIDFCSEMQEKYPRLKVLMITSYDEYSLFKNDLNDLTSGYISKDALPKVIVSAIQAVMEGKFFRYDKIVSPIKKEEQSENPGWLNRIVQEMTQIIKDDSNNREITEKLSLIIDATEKYRMMVIKDLLTEEKDILSAEESDQYLMQLFENLLVRGYSNWEIADILNVSIETVRIYRMDYILRLSGKNSMAMARIAGGETIELRRREIQLLRLIAAGYINQEIADILYLGVETVKTIRKGLIEKFKAPNTMVMIINALRMGLIKLEDIDDLLS